MPITSWAFLCSLCWLKHYYNSFHFSEYNPQNLTEICCVMTTFVLSLKNLCYCFRLPNCFPHHQNIWRGLFILHLCFLNIPLLVTFCFNFHRIIFVKTRVPSLLWCLVKTVCDLLSGCVEIHHIISGFLLEEFPNFRLTIKTKTRAEWRWCHPWCSNTFGNLAYNT